MYDHDTIAAIATPPGNGGIAIIRVSGPKAEKITRKVFLLSPPRDTLLPHHLYFGRVTDPLSGSPLDQGLLVLMRAPRSYTGEDVAEIHCHGGSFLSRRILEVVLNQGARLALPGEFTKRAFLNNRLDLSQAEAVLDLVQAKSEQGLQLAWEQLSGRLSDICSTIRERLLGLTAHIEACIDFPEDDIPERTQNEIQEEIVTLTREISSLSSTFAQGKVYREGVRTALVGKPNVGKSSLLNLLSGTERAIVTPIPGTTRDILEETIIVDGIPLVIWDTAGLRSTTDEIERIGVERAKAGLQAAELVLAIFDASLPLNEEDEAVAEAVSQKKTIPILNKIDLPLIVQPKDLEQRFGGSLPVLLSAKDGTGLEELRKRIKHLAFGDTPFYQGQGEPSGALIARVRHRDVLIKAEQSLTQARASLDDGLPLDLVAVDLRAALDHIGEITGHVTSEDILDRVFRDFCIGK